MKKISDVRYVQPERVARWLGRLCYPIGVAVEEKAPASARKLLEATSAAEMALFELSSPLGHSKRALERKQQRAVRAAKCARAVLKRLANEEQVAVPARITAAVEVADRLVEMIEAQGAAS